MQSYGGAGSVSHTDGLAQHTPRPHFLGLVGMVSMRSVAYEAGTLAAMSGHDEFYTTLQDTIPIPYF